MNQETYTAESPATLVAIIVAARRGGMKSLEREMRRQLEREFGVRLSFIRDRQATQRGVVANA
jgi:hypothetical protein